MRHLFILLLTFFPGLLAAQELRVAQELRRADGDWSIIKASGCIGGSTCAERRLRIPLEDRPVLAVRFYAHDGIGNKAEGVLRVKIDGNTINSYIDIPRRGETFTLDVDELTGRTLLFEPVNDDEVEISQVSVLYAPRSSRRRDDRVPPRRGGVSLGWRAYPSAAACIGGDECRRNGDRITIALENAPVLGVRFYAHDQIGTKADGRVSIRIDDETIGWPIDIQRAGKRHEIDVESISGSKLVIQAQTDDEVEVKDIEVLYGARERTRRGRSGPREITVAGKCIGGSECGGRRNTIHIPIYGRPVESIRFYARDDIGTRAGGELKIRIDDEVLEWSLDIPREGRTFTIAGNDTYGDYLIIEPAANDEVEVKDIRIRFSEDE